MKTFFVEYANKVRSVVHADLESVEHFCNQHFGTAWGVAKEFGARVVMTEHNLDAKVEDMPSEDPPAACPAVLPPVAPNPPAPLNAGVVEPPNTPPVPETPAPQDVTVGLTGNETGSAVGGAVTQP